MLKLEHVTKRFPQRVLPALDEVTVTINRGDYCIILGSNGSGKSTLIKTVLGEYAPSEGKILLQDHDISMEPVYVRAMSISSVAQDIMKGTVGEFSIFENIALSNMRMRSAKYQLFRNQLDNIIQEVKLLDLGLENYLHTPMSLLSGGQRQAVATLMSIISKPSILLLDEHTSALDPISKHKILEFTNKYINNFCLTTLMVTHNIADAIKYGNRLLIMHHGSIIYDICNSEKSQLGEKDVLNLMYQLGETI